MQDMVAELAVAGTIQARINIANVLLMTGHNVAGEPGFLPDR